MSTNDRRRTRGEVLKTVWVEPPHPLRSEGPVERCRTFDEDRAFLQRLFPRGRLRVHEDGRPVLVPRRKDLAGWHLFRDGAGVGIYWCGGWKLLEEATHGVSRRREEVRTDDEEGFLYLAADPTLAERLAWFSRRRPSGRPLSPEARARGLAALKARREASASVANPPPPRAKGQAEGETPPTRSQKSRIAP